MSDPKLRYETMLNKLRERGCRLTSNRLALMRLIAASEGHPTAAQLWEKLRVLFPTISLATVYKTLTWLKEEGEVLEIDLRTNSRYDGNKPYPHPHLICNQCGNIIDGDTVSFLDAINQESKEKFDFQVAQTQLVFFGLCGDCQNNEV